MQRGNYLMLCVCICLCMFVCMLSCKSLWIDQFVTCFISKAQWLTRIDETKEYVCMYVCMQVLLLLFIKQKTCSHNSHS